jgi:hypothetical protein
MTVKISPQEGCSFHHSMKEDKKQISELRSAVVVTEIVDTSTGATTGSESDPQSDGKRKIDTEALRARYDVEREKRLAANSTGFDQYHLIHQNDPFFGRYLDDPYISERITRDPMQEETEVLIIGGGYGAQLAAVRLIEKGITDIKLVEKGGDYGGTW